MTRTRRPDAIEAAPSPPEDGLVSSAGAAAMRATAKALLVRFADGYQRWIPLSQVHPTSAVKHAGDCGTLIVSTWLAATIADERAPVQSDLNLED